MFFSLSLVDWWLVAYECDKKKDQILWLFMFERLDFAALDFDDSK